MPPNNCSFWIGIIGVERQSWKYLSTINAVSFIREKYRRKLQNHHEL